MSETADTAEAEPKTGELVRFDKNNIVPFNQFKSDLDRLKEDCKKIIPDLTTPKGIKTEISYIYKIKQSKAALDRVRKTEKAESLEYGKEVDRQAAEIRQELENIIDAREKPLIEIEEKAKERAAEFDRKLLIFTNYKSSIEADPGMDSCDLIGLLDAISEVIINETWQEYQEAARMLQTEAITDLQRRIRGAEEREELQAENTRLKAEQEQRDQRDADEKREREQREEAEQRQQEQDRETERKRVEAINSKMECFTRYLSEPLETTDLDWWVSELECVEAFEVTEKTFEEFIDKAKLAQAAAVNGIRSKIEVKEKMIADAEQLQKLQDEKAERDQKEAEEEQERQQKQQLADDEAHRVGVNTEIIKNLLDINGMTQHIAEDVVEMVSSNEIPKMNINY